MSGRARRSSNSSSITASRKLDIADPGRHGGPSLFRGIVLVVVGPEAGMQPECPHCPLSERGRLLLSLGSGDFTVPCPPGPVDKPPIHVPFRKGRSSSEEIIAIGQSVANGDHGQTCLLAPGCNDHHGRLKENSQQETPGNFGRMSGSFLGVPRDYRSVSSRFASPRFV